MTDARLEEAIAAAMRARDQFRDAMQTDHAVRCIRAIEFLKACRRPEVVAALDADRLMRVQTGAEH